LNIILTNIKINHRQNGLLVFDLKIFLLIYIEMEREYKTPIYLRKAYDRYYQKNKESEEFKQKRRDASKKYYEKKKLLKKQQQELLLNEAESSTTESE